MANKAAFSHIQDEINQGHGTRRQLYLDLERTLGRKHHVIAFFTSFSWPVTISDPDTDMIEEALQRLPNDGKEVVLFGELTRGRGNRRRTDRKCMS